MANNMRKIARTCFRNAKVVIDRFHVQKLALEAVQEERIRLRWQAINEDNRMMNEAKAEGMSIHLDFQCGYLFMNSVLSSFAMLSTRAFSSLAASGLGRWLKYHLTICIM